MVGFVIGMLIGGLLGFMIMAFIKVGDTDDYYIDIIQTYDKEVNRQFKVIQKACRYIKENLYLDEKELINILEDKENE